jgi:anion-transporting  ArsA/GET3 family ATPase
MPRRGASPQIRSRRDDSVPRCTAFVAACVLSLSLFSCSLTRPDHDDSKYSAAVVDRAATSATLLASHVEVLQKLMQSPPAEQAEILAAAQRDFQLAATPSHQLRYALELAAPGHAGTNLPEADRLLRELMATPETLVAAERAFAYLELQKVNAQLTLAAENRTLQDSAAHADRERLVAANRHLQTEIDENVKLRKDLDDARAKLNAITNIERSLNDRKPSTSTEGHPP